MPFDARYIRSKNGEYPDAGDLNGRWFIAKPVPDPFVWRLRYAWRVLTGRADIIVWPAATEDQGGA